MITDALLDLLIIIVDAVVASVHSMEWGLTLPASVHAFISMMLSYDDLLPISDVMGAGGATFLVFTTSWGVKILIKVADWIADVIP